MGCLYKIEFPNGKIYIGISSYTAENRFKRHARSKSGTLVSRAIRKFGETNCKQTVLAIADNWEYLCLIERRAISIFNSKHPSGYNMTEGGDGALGVEWSKEAREKVSKFHKGRVKSEKEKEAMSRAQRGKPKNWTKEWKEAIAKANCGRRPHNKGLKSSDETKKRQSEARRNWWKSLSEDEKKKFQEKRELGRERTNEAVSKASKSFWSSMSEDQRKEFCKRRAEIQAAKRRV